MPDGTWSLAEAKAKFSELVERARTEGPQRLTRNGKDAVVVVSAEEYRRLNEAVHSASSGAAKPWLDPRFGVLTDEEHADLFRRDKDVGRTPVEF
ncbi:MULTISPECIES: type II toxin-antitoxin system Phd/YefM family antitoxin [unclassified Caulobacter]|jgi:prevent-host-death family protein|uniref:type II toxin-antitoxin system Phd/YefM family antitoxin n=1 Tax=unclassified Caulobacter TaxID=2648921 RepID=UPI000D3DB0A9|nr:MULTISPECIES: type II toxin-antitoxin system Phd/YefM family antitoxin [unclassified Caulobacter]PTS90356.1 prevent-host-death protein [Caulobacter sp. HMWF009]PTT08072.1 prevent-host-death protein [Caulobacter sp. HMWF025]PTT78721.1 prevent-host-death protein [Pseudomonas sp. HMWF010]